MKYYFSALVKAKFKHLNITNKRPYLAAHRQRIAGRVVTILFDKRTTTFEVSDFVKISKKLRSNTVEVQIRDIFQYNFLGLCIAHKKDPYLINTSFLVRNTFDRTPYELNVSLFSPIIESIAVVPSIQKLIHITHSKYYYLRKKPLPESTIRFNYVVDMFDHDTLYEEDSTIKEVEKNALKIQSTL
jgi:ribosomal protein L19